METKICSKCGDEKSVNEFNWRNKQAKKRHPACKDCTREAIRQHYDDNKKYYKDKAKPYRKVLVARNKKIVREHLEKHSCVDCGEKDTRVLHFDHVRGKKLRNISQITLRGWSLERLNKEINKCEIRCANCHMKKTFDELGWKK